MRGRGKGIERERERKGRKSRRKITGFCPSGWVQYIEKHFLDLVFTTFVV